MNTAKKPRIAVLTLNPGIDRTMVFDAPLLAGEVNRAVEVRTDQGCKGANAAIVLRRIGADVVYFTFTGGEFGAVYESFLQKEGVPTRTVPIAAGVRLNVKLRDAGGVYTECNQAGGPVSDAEWQAMRALLCAEDYDCLYLAGSLPQGLPLDTYAECVRLAHEKGAFAVADCAGALLEQTLKAAPDLIKPNQSEFAALMGEDLPPEQAMAVFRERHPDTALLLSLGADGAIFANKKGTWHAAGVKVPVRGTVAAGDTLLSTFTHALLSGAGEERALAQASAAAAAKVQLSATVLPTAAEMRALADNINVNEIQKK